MCSGSDVRGYGYGQKEWELDKEMEVNVKLYEDSLETIWGRDSCKVTGLSRMPIGSRRGP